MYGTLIFVLTFVHNNVFYPRMRIPQAYHVNIYLACTVCTALDYRYNVPGMYILSSIIPGIMCVSAV